MTQRLKVSRCYWEKSTKRPAQCRVATNLQFAKNTVSVESDKMRYACKLMCSVSLKATVCSILYTDPEPVWGRKAGIPWNPPSETQLWL